MYTFFFKDDRLFSGNVINLFTGHEGCHVGSQFSDQGLNLCPLHWECRVLTTGPPKKSKPRYFETEKGYYYESCQDDEWKQVLSQTIKKCGHSIFSCFYLLPLTPSFHTKNHENLETVN